MRHHARCVSKSSNHDAERTLSNPLPRFAKAIRLAEQPFTCDPFSILPKLAYLGRCRSQI
jgi:hypothetical protein